MRRIAVTVSIAIGLAVALGASSLHADVVILVDGTRIEGEIVEETDEYVVVRFEQTNRRIARERIRSIARSKEEGPPEEGAAAPTPGVTGPKEFTNSIGMRFIRIPAGTFRMGSAKTIDDDDEYGALVGQPDESPVHEVRITRAFYIGIHEVTFGQFEAFEESKGGVLPKKYRWYSKEDDEPANVAYEMAVAYCDLMTEKDPQGVSYRLPTEAEWEYAARGGLEGKTYPWGDGIDETKACYGMNRVRAVGSFAANGYGLHDVAGNVWEWTSDWYRPDSYETSPRDDPKGPPTGPGKVIRGGAFYDNELLLRVSARDWVYPTTGGGSCGAFALAPYGFRVVAVMPGRDAGEEDRPPSPETPGDLPESGEAR